MTQFVLPAVFALLLPFAAAGDDLQSLLEQACKKHEAPGALAAVIRDGKIVGVGAWGVRSLGGDPVEADDLAMIGSCGKSVTRLLIARLVDDGRLTFASTLGALLPDVAVRAEYKAVTVGDIIGHRAGLPAYTEIGPRITPQLFNRKGSPREQRAAFIAHLLQEQPAAEPGTRFVYSNAGYALLGHIAERLAGRPYEDLVAAEVFKPLGMTSARIGLPTEAPGRAALTGHRRGPSGYQPGERPPALPTLAPAGLMSCSISDFARLAGALVGVESHPPTGFLKPATAQKIRELRPGGGKSAGEGVPFFGGDGYYTAAFALWPSQKLGIVVATNAGENDAVCAAVLEAVRAKYAPNATPVPVEESSEAGPPVVPLGILFDARDAGDIQITEVTADSIAARAGVKAGDRLLAIDGVALSEIPAGRLRERLAGKQVVLTLERDGVKREVTLTRP